ncbi:MAG TPA: RuBisCO large subunit C-terminal-like domain-containing protein [Spirochaetota bacterium]|nr:RuBisCO large subunit C-terminal-like domain-containing protein [Spirochaetota bacterium]HPJ34869.1 RuBisCO large subunit C-terminal-like domain-containing protein [Spirochaetota bacterium]
MTKTVSGERFTVTYILSGGRDDALAAAEDICIEQTVEFPPELIKDDFIRGNIFGRVETFSETDENTFSAEISFAVETSASEVTQLFNVMLGNISLKPGIKIRDISLPTRFASQFKGPGFGVNGLRDILNAHNRPLISSAIKPMGLSSSDFADLAYRFAIGGMDIIKDDHGLSDQKFSPFMERVKMCCDAVNRANSETGGKTLYFPNITAPCREVIDRAYFAKGLGAGGVLISPALTGFDVMKHLADDENFGLPVMSHPAFIGSYLSGSAGFTHGALLGKIMRLCGADIVVYPNFGGRFSFSKDECLDIVDKCRSEFSGFKTIFPCPGGGMNFSNIPEMKSFYGDDVIYLMGGGLFRRSDDLVANCRELRSMVL